MCISKCGAPYGAFPKQAYWLTNCSGYYECKHTPGLWRHLTRPISFTLVVNDFGVKYVGKEHVNHLIKCIKEKYELTEDWSGDLYCGIKLHWDYSVRTVDISMPKRLSLLPLVQLKLSPITSLATKIT
jgi:hypothetical protein